MRVIFLDVDGVLNSKCGREMRKNHGCFSAFDLEASHIKLLQDLVTKTDAEIVLSSSWRYRFWDDGKVHLKEGPLYYALERHLEKFGLCLYDVTPYIGYEATRGDEISAWLSTRNDVSEFIILDDENDLYGSQLEDNLVQVSSETGLTKEECDKAISMLLKRGRKMEACIETIAKDAVSVEEKKCCNGNKCSNCTCSDTKGELKEEEVTCE